MKGLNFNCTVLNGLVYAGESQSLPIKILVLMVLSFVVGVGTSGDECSDIYRGKKAFSEIEVVTVARYLYNNKASLAGYMDIHAYSQLWMTPWGYTRSYPRDYREMVSIAIESAIILVVYWVQQS